RALAEIYRRVYRIALDDDALTAAAIWHDSLKAATLPFRDDGGCGPEPRIAGTPAHHVLGLAAAFVRNLPPGIILAIAAAHGTEGACRWFEAASIVAGGVKVPCPARLPIE